MDHSEPPNPYVCQGSKRSTLCRVFCFWFTDSVIRGPKYLISQFPSPRPCKTMSGPGPARISTICILSKWEKVIDKSGEWWFAINTIFDFCTASSSFSWLVSTSIRSHRASRVLITCNRFGLNGKEEGLGRGEVDVAGLVRLRAAFKL